jgi:hypothetical protein
MEKRPRPLLGVVTRLSRHPIIPVGLPLLMCGTSPHLRSTRRHNSLGGEGVKMPTLPHTISIVGPEQLLWFCLSSIKSEVLNRSSCSLGHQQVLGESRPFPQLILKPALLRYLL